MKKAMFFSILSTCLLLCAENIYAPGYKVEYNIGDVHYLFGLADIKFHLEMVGKNGTRKTVWTTRGDGDLPLTGTGFMTIIHIYASPLGADGKAYLATVYDLWNMNTSMEVAEISKDGVKSWHYFIGGESPKHIERIVLGKEGTLLMLAESKGEVNPDGGGIRVFTADHVLETGRANHVRNYLHTPPSLCGAIEKLRPDEEFLRDYGTVGKDEFAESFGEYPLKAVLYKYIYSKYIHVESPGVVPPLEKIDRILSKVIAKDELKVSDEELDRIAETLRPLLHKNIKYIDRKYAEPIPGSDTYYGFAHWRQRTLLRNIIAVIHHYSCDELLAKPLDVKIVDRRRRMAWEIEAMEKDKRRFLSVKTLFTEEEIKKVFAEPNPADFKDSLSLARAYDFAGCFRKALETYRKCDSIQGRFELGRLLMAGRPGIAADPEEARRIFTEIEEDVSVMQEPSPELLCLAGRACLEMCIERQPATEKLRRRGGSYLERALSGGFADARYYLARYGFRSFIDDDAREVERKAASQELRTWIKLLCNPSIEGRFNDKEEERDFCRKAILEEHSVSALCWLGECHLGEVFDDEGRMHCFGESVVEWDREKALFWISKAADRGFERAEWLMGKFFKEDWKKRQDGHQGHFKASLPWFAPF